VARDKGATITAQDLAYQLYLQRDEPTDRKEAILHHLLGEEIFARCGAMGLQLPEEAVIDVIEQIRKMDNS
jgi:hypothetical protein